MRYLSIWVSATAVRRLRGRAGLYLTAACGPARCGPNPAIQSGWSPRRLLPIGGGDTPTGVGCFMDTRTAFSVLGLPATAPPEAVKDAYRDLVKVWHPDRFAGDARLQAKATDRMRELNEAYAVAVAHASSFPSGSRRRPAPEPECAQYAGAAPPAASVPPATASASGRGRSVYPPLHLTWDAIWRTLFFAATVGVIAFIVTAPDGFFALSKGRSAGRQPRGHATGPQVFEKLPESEHGEADLVSRVRGTWVVVETADAEWLPSGTHVDLGNGGLVCSGPRTCQATVKPIGAARFAIRGAASEDGRDVEVSFASPTTMQWVARPAGTTGGPTRRVVLESQGDEPGE
jgi:hypothetical protein